ncbi:MAG: hypothetical protein EOO27_50890, partial [Comamonadaceae bacterium]
MSTIDRRIFLTLAGGAATMALLPLAGCGGGDPYPPVTGAGQGPMSATAEGRQFQALGKSHTLVIKESDGRELRCGGIGFGKGKLNFPAGVAVLDGLAYVVETGNHRVQVFDGKGTVRSIIGEGELLYPGGIAAGKKEIFVADTRNARIVAFSPNGRLTRVLGAGVLSAPRGITVQDDGLLIADPGLRKVIKLGFDGVVQAELGSDWILPYDVATDGAFFYVADVARNELGVVA